MGKRLARIAKSVFSTSEFDNSNRDSPSRIAPNYDALFRFASRLRAGRRTAAKPRYAPFAEFLLILILAQT
jgi:hypothetical protein